MSAKDVQAAFRRRRPGPADSRPELEAAELRRFASVLFAEYVARDLGFRQ